MLLVIPSIKIRDGVSVGGFSLNGAELPELAYPSPVDRARLLRKENAKALHLIIEGGKEWTQENLELIELIRQSVDIPIEVSLSSIPDNLDCIRQLIQSGIYRLFLPYNVTDVFLTECISGFSKQKISLTFPFELANQDTFSRLKADGVGRACITLQNDQPLDLELARSALTEATAAGLRLSLLFGVYSYETLVEVLSLTPSFDSVILGTALEQSVFPCQNIWRGMEIEATKSRGMEANLWRNPLAGVPHI
ncbi:MAG: HisA/HisF-related TIM barrel protein [bacterium]